MELNFKGKVVLVTAASRGLGRAVATEMSREGAAVIICSRDKEKIEKAAQAMTQETGNHVTPLVCDVANRDAIHTLFEQVESTHGLLDVLVCNAGGPPGGTFESLDEHLWQTAFETNLLSVVRLVRDALPLLKKQGGKILTIASSSVKTPIPGLILSNVMRAGIAGLMKTLANELAPYGILVNTICPGRIATDRVFELDSMKAEKEGLTLADVRKASESHIPLGRYGEPAEFAKVVAFLASGANSYVTGQTLLIDGGYVQAL